jgi:hypothetical protein
VGIWPGTVYKWKDAENDEFKELFARAERESWEISLSEAQRRGVRGWLEPVFQGGRASG